ncbi:acetoacetate decarboxylase [Leptolyngbya sp. 'hensonii']|uniref:acetoacetate decarboxylase family protein n=1 Tax=Leptolyngbya sp. 'hensonii' TaxID=1922337 RepID=UPI00094F8455|nr:acetoacetate decarboxylase family protein [Leptolyngbya sp. 'hensonii']OLP15495.1 acetoacetate decarboxylase [Leptolyngbya sp. 'hensonii']
MVYPAAPWTLKGYGVQSLYWVRCDRARPFIPPELQPVEVWPGWTIGTVYLAHYGAGSTLEYNELIVVAGMVRLGKRLGAWISHIYVDHPDSVAGGREIWGLPKELAQFTWESGQCTVRQGDRLLCRLSYQQPFYLWQQSLKVPSFGNLQGSLLWFEGQAQFRLGLTWAQLEIPEASPFFDLHLGSPVMTLQMADLNLLASPPA